MFATASQRAKSRHNVLSVTKSQHIDSKRALRDDISPEYASKYILKGFLSYLTSIYSDGEISEESYHALVNRSATLSVEAMTMRKMQALLQEYEEYFERAVEEYFA